MSTENDTAEGQPPDRPLDPYTLRVVLAELDRRPTTPSEEVVSDLLATANPRARVVVLPENIGGGVAVGGESYVHFIHGITGYSTGEVGVVGIRIAALGLLGRMPAAEAAAMGRSLIAAAEFAGGEK